MRKYTVLSTVVNVLTVSDQYRINGQDENRKYFSLFPVPGDAPDFHRIKHFGSFESNIL